MNAAAAGKFALCICTGAVLGAGVNEARNTPKPAVQKSAAKAPAGHKVVQFPCEPFIVQDQMMRDASIPSDFEITDIPRFAALTGPGGRRAIGGNDGGDGVDDGDGGTKPVPEPAMLGLFGIGVAGLMGGRKLLLTRLKS